MPLNATVDAAAGTDIGLVRHSNQDSFGSDEQLGLYVVCDGMGGAAGGEVASRIATDTFLAIVRQEIESDRSGNTSVSERALERAAAAANRAVCTKASYDTRYRGMGTTLVAARVEGNELTVVNVGDSRAYLLHDGELRQLTRDHSYLDEQVERGLMTREQAEASSLQSVITRAIGAEPDVHADVFHATLDAGDVLLLTSDGLTRPVSDEQIAAVLADESTAEGACARLIELARNAGGPDNITCFVVRVRDAA